MMESFFIGNNNTNKFERKNCIFKICSMRIFFSVILLGIILTFSNEVKGQTTTIQTGNVVKIKLPNDFNAILVPSVSGPNVEVCLYVKTGSIFEEDSMNGLANLVENIMASKIAAYLRSNQGTVSFQNTTFNPVSTPERAVFKLTTSSGNIPACLNLLRDSILNSKITATEMNRAVNEILQQIEDEKHNNRKMFEAKLLKMLYVQDHEKLEVLGKPEVLKTLRTGVLSAFCKKYYVSNNTILTVTGNFSSSFVGGQIESIFKPLVKAEFDPESITKIHAIHPIAFATQFVQEDTTAVPEFQICWQYPGSSAGREASYSAYLLSAILNDKNNFIQVKLSKMGCKKFTVQYEPNIFNGILRVTLQPSKANFFGAYNFVMKELNRLDETLLNDEMINVARLEFKKEYSVLQKGKDYAAWMAKTWSYNDETYFQELGDSVYNVTMPRLRSFIVEYMNQRPPVVGLLISKADRESMQVDTAFTDIDEGVGKYVFKYKQNVTDLEGNENKVMLRNLWQWLKINDDVIAQINGFSDEHEYNRSADDTIIRFMDSIPTFFKISKDIIQKGYLRPEMMRAMKIIKYLHDHGIADDRLTGTSMMFKSANKQEETDNLKCTLTLNKYHKSPSLYEYHYGKKKADEK